MNCCSRYSFWIKRSLYFLLLGSGFFILLLCWSSYVVEHAVAAYLYDSTDHLPSMETAVVLGTSRYTAEGHRNAHYYERLEAAAQLYQKGIVHYIIASGDNRTPYYNEPVKMKVDLMQMGVPASAIYRDYAGFRTLDSVVRAEKVFDQKQFIIVSQKYQNIRAVYIARAYGIKAIAYDASGEFSSFDIKNHLRVWLARLLAVIQVNLFHTQPRFLGPLVIPGTSPPS